MRSILRRASSSWLPSSRAAAPANRWLARFTIAAAIRSQSSRLTRGAPSGPGTRYFIASRRDTQLMLRSNRRASSSSP